MAACVTLITGASSGIGAATARRLATPDQALFLHARGGSNGSKITVFEDVAASVRATGAEVETVIADLSQPHAASRLVEAAVARFGQLDRIVSNAGYALAKPIGAMQRSELDNSFAVMTGAFADLITAALPHLQASGCGRVVAVSSFVAHRMPDGRVFPASAAAKGGLEALARAFARQVARDGITVNCIAPGYTRKDQSGHAALPQDAWKDAAEMTPNGRLAEPDDIAAAIAFLLSDEAAHITGQTLHVDGGLSLT
jgi:NAD(P)-dependent dehydrogenase (short-subunit alcohol dehydrogenase family)